MVDNITGMDGQHHRNASLNDPETTLVNRWYCGRLIWRKSRNASKETNDEEDSRGTEA
jgi:hypothetical protein